MVNVNKLRGAVVEHGFTLKEVDGIVKALSLTPDEGMRIFFAQNVA